MPLISLPYPRTVHNATKNGKALAVMLRNAENVVINGSRIVDGGCSLCGRIPPSKRLLEIVLDPSLDSRVQIGIGRCSGHHLGVAVDELLTAELSKDPSESTQVSQLQNIRRRLG